MGRRTPAAREHFREKVLHGNIRFCLYRRVTAIGLSSQFAPQEIPDVHRMPGVPPSPRILRLDPAGGKRDQLVHGPEIELVFDTRPMTLDGLGAQMEFLRDLDGAFASSDKLKDFPFPVAQALDGRSFGAVAGDVLEHRAGFCRSGKCVRPTPAELRASSPARFPVS